MRYFHIIHKCTYGKDQRDTFTNGAETCPRAWNKHGRAHFLRQRCLAFLLKAEGLSSAKIAERVDFCQQSVVVLDNAKIHRAKKVMCCRELWEKRGFFIFFLPPYSPLLNLAETL